jgi:hypothetical protein
MRKYLDSILNTDSIIGPLLFVLAALLIVMLALFGINTVWGVMR